MKTKDQSTEALLALLLGKRRAGRLALANLVTLFDEETGPEELKASRELVLRLIAEEMQAGPTFEVPRQVCQYLQLRLKGREAEAFLVLFLDNRHRLLVAEELFHGTIDGASIHPREVVKRALRNNAAAVILAHNHPSGVAEPSQADIAITRRLRDALALVEVRVLDHIIVGDCTVSLAERGLV